MKKLLIIAGAAIAVLIAALVVLIKVYVTPERIKEFVIPTAETSLNRKIAIGDINIGLFKGIGISDFAIRETDQQHDFVKCREFVLKFKLLPLLSKQLVIDELKLVSPEINIKRSKEGAFNFEDIGKKKETAEAQQETPGDKPGGLPISLLVNRIAVEDARLSLADLMKELPDIKSSADIAISIESVDGSNIFSEGSVDITFNEIIMAKPAGKRVADLFTGLKYAVNFNLESKDIRIDRADLKVGEITASIKGDVRNLQTSPAVDVALTLDKVNTSELQKLAALFADLKGLSLSGTLAADVKLDGEVKKLDTLKAEGNITMEKVGITYDKINALLDGNMKFDEKVMNIDIKGAIDKNTAEIKGSVRNYFDNQNIDFTIYSPKLILDELIPAGTAQPKAPAEGGQPGQERAAKPSEEAKPLDLKLTAKGQIKVDSAVYQNMTMSDFIMQVTFKENKLEIPEMSAKAGKGVLNVKSLVDLSKPGYTYRLSTIIDSLHADEMVNSFFPKAKDTVFGMLSLNLKMNGAGTVPDQIRKNLVADGDFNLKEGKITGARITEGLSGLLGIDELKTIDFKEARGTLQVKNRLARIDTIFSSDDLSLDPKGNIGLDETLDLAFDLKLAPRLTDKAMSSKIAKYIKSDEGWGTIPLKVTGTFAKPSYMVDVEKAGKQVIKKEADKYIDKLFDKQDEEKKKELEPVKDLLKGIFK